MKPRISLRGLLVFTAMVATFCYWWDRPARVAHEFAAAIQAGDPKAIRSLAPKQRGFHKVFRPGPNPHVTLNLDPFSFHSWIRRLRYATIDIDSDDGLYGVRFKATADGIDINWSTR